MSQGQINAEKNNQTNTTNVSNGPSECEITYMKLVADVYKDIAGLSVKTEYIKHRQDCFYLFNKSSAIRKLVVFLANENLDRIKLVGNTTNDKTFKLFQVALQPVWSFPCFYQMPVNIKPVSKNMQKDVKLEFDQTNNIVYYDQGKFPKIKNEGYNEFVAYNAQFLSKVVETIKTVIDKDKNVQKSFQDNNGVVKGLPNLDDKTKKNMHEILANCLEEKEPESIKDLTFGQKLAKLWNAFLNFLGLGEKVTNQDKIIIEMGEMEEEQAANFLSGFLKDASEQANAGKIKNQEIK